MREARRESIAYYNSISPDARASLRHHFFSFLFFFTRTSPISTIRLAAIRVPYHGGPRLISAPACLLACSAGFEDIMDERNPPDKGKAIDDNGDEAPRAEFNSPIFNNIRSSLQRKDDTSRFVGLTMLRSFLDSPSELRDDPQILVSLWEAISPKFLDRLIKSKGVDCQKDGNRYPTLDLGVSVLHRFTLLLPEETRRESRLVGKIPTLVDALVQRSVFQTRFIRTLIMRSRTDNSIPYTARRKPHSSLPRLSWS